MAISKGDGKIILGTEVDTSGAKKGMLSLKNITQNTGKTFTKLAGAIATAFSVTAIIQFSNESSKLASQTEASVLRLVDIYGQASQAVGDYIDQNAAALGMSKASAASFSAVYGNLFSVWADQATNAELTTQYLNMTAVVASKTGRTMEDVQERIRSGLLGNTEAVEDLGIFVNVKTIEMTEAFQSLADGRSWEQLTAHEQSQVRTLAIMEQATQKYGSQVAETTSLTRARYQAAYEDFQNTWGQVVNTVLMPMMEVATDFLNIMTKGLQVLGGISDSTIDASMYADTIGLAAENQNNLTTAIEETAEAQKKAQAGFDTLNIISDTEETAKSTETPANGNSSTTATISSGDTSKTSKDTESELTHLMGVIGGALIAIGVILLVTGHIAWGIGFIIAGAALFAVSMAAASEDDVTGSTTSALTFLMGVVGGALVAIGVILIIMGSIGIGIGLIVAGVATVGAAIVTIAMFDPNSITSILNLIMGVAAGALIAIGLMLLTFNGPSPISIGLLVAGAALLAAAVALNWGAIVEAIRGPIGVIMAIVGASLIAIGIILICVGFIPLGIGILVAGAVALAAPIAANWDAIIDKVKSITEKIGGFFSKVWDGIKKGFKAMVNGIISFANIWIDGLNLLLLPIRGLIVGIAQAFGSDISFKDVKIPHIPKLAQGAVIPPNREFLAILGDQKSGTNIEAPLDTIVEAFKLAQQGQTVNINFTGNLSQLARVLTPEITTENNRASIYAR